MAKVNRLAATTKLLIGNSCPKGIALAQDALD